MIEYNFLASFRALQGVFLILWHNNSPKRAILRVKKGAKMLKGFMYRVTWISLSPTLLILLLLLIVIEGRTEGRSHQLQQKTPIFWPVKIALLMSVRSRRNHHCKRLDDSRQNVETRFRFKGISRSNGVFNVRR